MRDPRRLFAVFAGGALGALARTGLVQLYPSADGGWPWVTFVVNVVGCVLLGYVVVRAQERLPASVYLASLMGTGFCGALTTFSTMQAELFLMIERGRYALALAYASASLLSGIAGVWIATVLARRTRTIG